MALRRRRRRSRRTRIGNVSLYEHHGSWWIHYRESGLPQRRRIGRDEEDARIAAAEVNAQLTAGRPTLFSYTPVPLNVLANRWLDHHEHILRSAVATRSRYRTAIDHLCRYFDAAQPGRDAHEVNVTSFVRYLRTLEVTPNGHANAARRPLRDKGIQFILAACRSLYNYGAKQRLLPPYYENPFAALPIDRLPIEDAKPIHVFSADQEAAFFKACDPWQWPVFYILAKAGLRSGELAHLLVEDVDQVAGVLHIRNKSELGWQIKTRNVRSIPLPAQPLAVLRHLVAGRNCGVLFLRRRFHADQVPLAGKDVPGLAEELDRRIRRGGQTVDSAGRLRVARTVWRDAGAVKPDQIRTEFMRLTRRIGLPAVTAPKCWRHTFATLMQEAGVDPLIRQQTMGHVPGGAGPVALGMTATYTHTQPQVHRRQLQHVLDLRPQTAQITQERLDTDVEGSTH